MAFLALPLIGDHVSHCLLDYIDKRNEGPPMRLIFATKRLVEHYVKGKVGHFEAFGGWCAHFNKRCVVVNLDDVDTSRVKKKDDERTKKGVQNDGEDFVVGLAPHSNFIDSDVETEFGGEENVLDGQERDRRMLENEKMSEVLIANITNG